MSATDSLSASVNSDHELFDLVQSQTARYFLDYSHPDCAMARDRLNVGEEIAMDLVATGGSGFGVMATIVAVERGWIARADAIERLHTMLGFLESAESYNGVFPHFFDAATGKEYSFWPDNAGGDLVETAYLCAGLLCARQYYDGSSKEETELRARIGRLWANVNWNWHTKGGDILFWHWSPTHQRGPHQEIGGWNECLIAYILAASSPKHSVDPKAYHNGWAKGRDFLNGKSYYGIKLPLGPDYGGPLFFAHYSFLGLDPRGLTDRYADYWEQNVSHTLINYEHCVRNPNGYTGYGPDCWGLTSSDGDGGYGPHSPTEDKGVISPSAALSSFPYTPSHSWRALKHFYFDLGSRIWGKFGFHDAFNQTKDWYKETYIAIDQGPIVVMMENYRTGLLWRLFMSCPEVATGLERLGFKRKPQIS